MFIIFFQDFNLSTFLNLCVKRELHTGFYINLICYYFQIKLIEKIQLILRYQETKLYLIKIKPQPFINESMEASFSPYK